MATSVTINGASVIGDVVLVDCTVAGAHHVLRCDKQALDAIPTTALKQDFICRQAVSQSNQTLPATSTDTKLNLTGTYSVGGTTVVINGMVRQGDNVLVDATVGGAHQTAVFKYDELTRYFTSGISSVQTHAAQQMKGASAVTVNTAPILNKLDLRGTLSV